MKMKLLLLLSLFIFFFSGLIGTLKLSNSSPENSENKTLVNSLSDKRTSAIKHFWQTFEHGAYDQINNSIVELKALYLENPNDSEIALLIAHLHFWKVAERFRLKENVCPNITDHLIVAGKYFEEAQDLNPKDARIDGWLAGVDMSLAEIHNNPKNMRKAYFRGKKSIRKYPAFNHFSIAYLFSNRPYNDRFYKKAINSFFKSMDIATHNTIDRDNFNYEAYLYLEKEEPNERLKRAVWNGPKAKHNLEGFFLIMGDFLVKAGRTEEALIAYNNAKLIPSFEDWPFKDILNRRISDITVNVEHFKITSKKINENPSYINSVDFSPDRSMIFNSYNCTVCHQAY